MCSAESCTVPARGKYMVNTDISIAIPQDCYARVAPRSGLAWKHSIDTGAGVIDCDYRGPVKVILFNFSDVDFQVRAILCIQPEISVCAMWVSGDVRTLPSLTNATPCMRESSGCRRSTEETASRSSFLSASSHRRWLRPTIWMSLCVAPVAWALPVASGRPDLHLSDTRTGCDAAARCEVQLRRWAIAVLLQQRRNESTNTARTLCGRDVRRAERLHHFTVNYVPT